MNTPESLLRDARWRASTWRSVERIQHEHGPRFRLVAGTAATRTARRGRLRVETAQTLKRNST